MKPFFLTCIDRCQQFERVELLAAGVHLLEHKADGLAACTFAKLDYRHLILVEGRQHLVQEFEPELHLVWGVLPVRGELGQPVVPIEDAVGREHALFKLSLFGRQIPNDLLAEVPRLNLALGDAHKGVDPVNALVQGARHIDVVEAFDLLLLGVHRLDNASAHRRLIQRGQALLTIQEQRLRCDACAARRRAFNGAGFELHLAARLQGHDRSDREGPGNRCQEAPQPLVVPHPAALEIRQLDQTIASPLQKVIQRLLSAVKFDPCHSMLLQDGVAVIEEHQMLPKQRPHAYQKGTHLIDFDVAHP